MGKIVDVFAAKAAKEKISNPLDTLLSISQNQGVNPALLAKAFSQNPWLMGAFLKYVNQLNDPQFIKDNTGFSPSQWEIIKDERAY